MTRHPSLFRQAIHAGSSRVRAMVACANRSRLSLWALLLLWQTASIAMPAGPETPPAPSDRRPVVAPDWLIPHNKPAPADASVFGARPTADNTPHHSVPPRWLQPPEARWLQPPEATAHRVPRRLPSVGRASLERPVAPRVNNFATHVDNVHESAPVDPQFTSSSENGRLAAWNATQTPPATSPTHVPRGTSVDTAGQGSGTTVSLQTVSSSDQAGESLSGLPISAALGFSPAPTLTTPSWPTVTTAADVYDAKYPVPTERPWIEWGRPFYGDGMIAPGGTVFGPFNLTHPTFYLYGDYRLGIGSGRNAVGRFDNLATRLNLDMDFQITSTERLHAFIGPLNNAGQFSQVSFDDGELDFESVINLNPVTGYFEGDLGYMLGGLSDQPAEFDLPIAAGLMPLFYQNGVWMDDAVTGIALAQNAKHSRLLKWSNFDATAFAILDQLDSPAFGTDNHAAQALGTAWFIEAYGGYIETGYAYVYDRKGQQRTYHNATIAYTRRYFDRIGNSVRLIINAGQDRPQAERTADGGVVLIENNWITAKPLTFVPYCNLFYGWGRPQSLARNGLAGGILRNTGINFETDGLNGFPTLDPTAINTFGGAVGVNLLGANLEHQLILEAALVQTYGLDTARVARGNQYGIGARYQRPLSHCTLIRLDAMVGWREQERDLYGTRMEFRYKF